MNETASQPQRLLFDKQAESTQIYSFQINSGGTLQIKESGIVTIVFRNNKFQKTIFPFTGTYSRNAWRILAAIEEEIQKIEEDLNLD